MMRPDCRKTSSTSTRSSADSPPACPDAGAGIRFVRDWLGHGNMQNTLIYACLTSRTRNENTRRLLVKMLRV